MLNRFLPSNIDNHSNALNGEQNYAEIQYFNTETGEVTNCLLMVACWDGLTGTLIKWNDSERECCRGLIVGN